MPVVGLAVSLCVGTGCSSSGPLGMATGDIKDWQISASSTFPSDWDPSCHQRYARLYQLNGLSWCAKYKATSEWLQIDLGIPAKVRTRTYIIINVIKVKSFSEP